MSRTDTQEDTKLKVVDSETAARQSWMGLLARAPTGKLETTWAELDDQPNYGLLRAPETGMVMVRARAGGEGERFNLGEMTVTHCVVRTDAGRMGQAYVAGRDHRHAELAAVFDAMMQDPDWRSLLQRDLMDPVQSEIEKRQNMAAGKSATTKVDFFTMVRGED